MELDFWLFGRKFVVKYWMNDFEMLLHGLAHNWSHIVLESTERRFVWHYARVGACVMQGGLRCRLA